ncbi:hypothetical protein [Pallidibacillus pasinlerensis]|uniref:Uncharacterized protein n=1 Tax=Pallidibacillus pasinlerensis TaxID=2703818 RepID=A0ABX0A508_9BACI|nr:hypothetical protein [Pallidibacillus pasinlerensis]NCU18515.1 hypothetical protein [Pallidibacillus pasinlerensis]
MKKKIFSLGIVLVLLLSISSTASAAAKITPSQTIRGQLATAKFSMSWSGGSGEYTWRLNLGDGNIKTQSRTNRTGDTYEHNYQLKSGVQSTTYTPTLSVYDYKEPSLTVGLATGKVYHFRY